MQIEAAPILIADLPAVKQVSAGLDHVLFLTRDGQVMAMGDDTFGQCGHAGENRQTVAPFFESRFRKPVNVKIPALKNGSPQKVTKIVSGFRHCMAITDTGKLYGWGYNNQMQLSHSQEYGDDSNPSQAIFTPKKILGPLEDMFVVDAAGGEEMSIIVAQGKKAGIIFEQVYACGNNLKGSLGINRPSHLQDLTLVPDLSDLFDETEQALMVTDISCGRRHCMAKYDYGGFKFWGDN